jgi:hypothetical protein
MSYLLHCTFVVCELYPVQQYILLFFELDRVLAIFPNLPRPLYWWIRASSLGWVNERSVQAVE